MALAVLTQPSGAEASQINKPLKCTGQPQPYPLISEVHANRSIMLAPGPATFDVTFRRGGTNSWKVFKTFAITLEKGDLRD